MTLARRLMRMATDESGAIKEAKIRLDPPSLGTIDLQLRVEDNKISVQFQSASAVVREMITQHLDKLRAQFNDGEMNLVNVDVSSGDRQQKATGEQVQGINGSYAVDSADDLSLTHTALMGNNHDYSGQGLLRIYA